MIEAGLDLGGIRIWRWKSEVLFKKGPNKNTKHKKQNEKLRFWTPPKKKDLENYVY